MVRACTLFSSSKGNATYIKSGNDEILIDAGASARSIEEALSCIGTDLSNIRAVFITHEHYDHIKGLSTITKHYQIPVFMPTESAAVIDNGVRPYIHYNEPGDTVELESIRISTYRTPHDSLMSVCFRIETENKTIGYATDIGHLSSTVQTALIGCEAVLIESNHDIDMLKNGPYPYSLKRRILGDNGHLSNEICARFLPVLVKGGAKSIVLGHLSENSNRPHIAYSASRGSLNAGGISVAGDRPGADVRLAVAAVNGITDITI